MDVLTAAAQATGYHTSATAEEDRLFKTCLLSGPFVGLVVARREGGPYTAVRLAEVYQGGAERVAVSLGTSGSGGFPQLGRFLKPAEQQKLLTSPEFIRRFTVRLARFRSLMVAAGNLREA